MTKNNMKESISVEKFVCNPLSSGILYFGFAISLWSSKQIDNNQIMGIAILFTAVSIVFFLAVYSKWIFNLVNKVNKYLTMLSFIAFLYGFMIGWVQTLSEVSGVILALVVYFGFAWLVTIILIEVKEIPSKRTRVTATIAVAAILISIAISRFVAADYYGGGALSIISILMFLVALGTLKLQGSIFE